MGVKWENDMEIEKNIASSNQEVNQLAEEIYSHISEWSHPHWEKAGVKCVDTPDKENCVIFVRGDTLSSKQRQVIKDICLNYYITVITKLDECLSWR